MALRRSRSRERRSRFQPAGGRAALRAELAASRNSPRQGLRFLWHEKAGERGKNGTKYEWCEKTVCRNSPRQGLRFYGMKKQESGENTAQSTGGAKRRFAGIRRDRGCDFYGMKKQERDENTAQGTGGTKKRNASQPVVDRFDGGIGGAQPGEMVA